ncbi:MAG: alpha/beta hydrolase [Planctomycetaceae bacterium]
MPLDPEVVAFLASYNAAQPPALWEISPAASRAAVTPVPGPVEPVGQVEDRIISGAGGELRLRLYEPTAAPVGTSLFFHGGGWVTGDLDTHDALCRRVANVSQNRVLAVDYRCAPEHPYPAAVNDAYTSLQWASEQYSGPLAVWGDSAGGNLAAGVAVMTRDRAGPPLVAQALVYPITDHDFERPSYYQYAEGHFLTRDAMRWFWDQYVPNRAHRDDPYVSPLRAESLANLPPTLLLSAECDVLRDEGLAYAAALQSAGVPVELVHHAGMIHGFLRRLHLFSRANLACQQIGEFLKSRLDIAAP